MAVFSGLFSAFGLAMSVGLVVAGSIHAVKSMAVRLAATATTAGGRKHSCEHG